MSRRARLSHAWQTPPLEHSRRLRSRLGSTNWRNGFGEQGYGGPQPPVGDEPHRYYFRLFALGRPLNLPPDASSNEVRKAVEGDHLAVGTLVGLFAR